MKHGVFAALALATALGLAACGGMTDTDIGLTCAGLQSALALANADPVLADSAEVKKAEAMIGVGCNEGPAVAAMVQQLAGELKAAGTL
jgi:hypothetical protein